MATNKQLLNEISRFQAIAGLRPINSLNEDAYEEGMDVEEDVDMEEGMELEEDAMSALHSISMAGKNLFTPDVLGVLGEFTWLGSIIAIVAAGLKGGQKYTLNQLIKAIKDEGGTPPEPGTPEYKALSKLALQKAAGTATASMDKNVGGTGNAGIGGSEA